jgi:hypothetical protein
MRHSTGRGPSTQRHYCMLYGDLDRKMIVWSRHSSDQKWMARPFRRRSCTNLRHPNNSCVSAEGWSVLGRSWIMPRPSTCWAHALVTGTVATRTSYQDAQLFADRSNIHSVWPHKSSFWCPPAASCVGLGLGMIRPGLAIGFHA